MRVYQIIKTLTHVLLTVVIVLFILTGFGITNYQLVDTITQGALSKPLSFQLHTTLILPLVLLLVLHIGFSVFRRVQKK